MPNFYDDNPDVQFYVDKWIDWEPLVRLTEYDFKAPDAFKNVEEALEVYKGILDLMGSFSADEIAPRAAQIDLEHPKLVNGDVIFPPVLEELFEQVKALELHGMCIPRELGGMNCPYILFMLGTELMARADVSVTAHVGFHGGMALAMIMFSLMEGSTEFDEAAGVIQKTRFEEYIREIVAGEAWGSMDITEQGAGSDMARLESKGEQDAEGNWFVSGRKIFITSGHAKYHFVIARTEEQKDKDDAFAGLEGLSMFLVPTYSVNEDGGRTYHATFEKLEEKLGHHGSATVAINFERTPAHLLGQRGEGFKLMLLLMNNARVGVGFESIGACEAALRLAKAYAAERPSMGKMIEKHEMIADMLDEMQNDIQGIRAICVQGGYHEEMTQKIRIMLKFLPPKDAAELKALEREMAAHQRKSRRLTPLVKYLASEKAVEMARRSIQIHGGYGYMCEYGAEKILRDAMVMPIYEGTSQIQALMVMKDTLVGVIKNPKAFFGKLFRAKIARFTGGTQQERRVAALQYRVYRVTFFLLWRLTGSKMSELKGVSPGQWGKMMQQWDPKKDFALAMLHAEHLTRMLADVAICEQLLAQTQKFPERAKVLEGYLERAEPRSKYYNNLIRTTGKRLLGELGRA